MARKAEHERHQQEIDVCKAALLAQGIIPESRAERKRRLAREAMTRPQSRNRAEVPAVFERRPPSSKPYPGPSVRIPDRPEPAPDRPLPPLEFKKRRRFVPLDEQ